MYEVRIGTMLLPVTPEKISWKYNSDNKTLDLINTGEINIIRPLKLIDLSFSFELPSHMYPYARYDDGVFKPAKEYLDYLYGLMRERKSVEFNIIRKIGNKELFLLNDSMKVTIEDLSFDEEASNGSDILVSISLKEFKDVIANVIVQKDNGEAEVEKGRALSDAKEDEVPSSSNVKNYTVVKGDSLWSICKKHYGDGNKYKDVAKLNNISNPNFIKAGQVIKLE